MYTYRFTRVSPAARASGDLAKHTAEIRYVFGNLAPAEDYDLVDDRLSSRMQEAWTTFAADGAPSTAAGPWPAYRSDAPVVTVLGDEVTTEPVVADPLVALIADRRND